MRDFDTERAARAAVEQGFKIGGEEFRVAPGVHPSVLLAFENTEVGSREELQAIMDTAIKAFLTSDVDRKRWENLRERTDDPVTYGDMRAVMSYLYEVESQLPTIALSPSSTGRERTSRSSGAATSSPAGTAT